MLPFLAVGMGALLAVVALVVDLSRLMLVRAELQSAADACALSAVQELNQTAGQMQRAERAGKFAASLVPRGFQSLLTTAESDAATTVTFSETGSAYTAAGGDSTAAARRFARCEVTHPGLGSVIGAAVGATTGGRIAATATATARPASRACLVPLALEKPNLTSSMRDYGFVKGRVYYLIDPTLSLSTSLLGASVSVSDYRLRLIDLSPGQNSALSTLLDEISNGRCDVEMQGLANQRLVTVTDPGQLSQFWGPWNSRFGLYSGNSLRPSNTGGGVLPDLTGWAPAPPALRVSGGGLLTDVLSIVGLPRALTRETENTRFVDYSREAGLRSVTPTDARPAGFAPTPSSGSHREFATSGRRLITLPVTGPASSGNPAQRNIIDHACALMYRPAGQVNQQVSLLGIGVLGIRISITDTVTFPLSVPVEFLGFANDPDSPCRSNGTPGAKGALGPLVPALVQ